jgi:hypothetical protein
MRIKDLVMMLSSYSEDSEIIIQSMSLNEDGKRCVSESPIMTATDNSGRSFIYIKGDSITLPRINQ